MTLKDKLDLLSLSEEERSKAESKYLVTFALISSGDLKAVVQFLESQNVVITRAREIKILAIPKEEMVKKFGILAEVHETDIYVQNPSRICCNALDIYKKIKYCKQVGKEYRKPDGKYEDFLFNETAWEKEFSRRRAEKIVGMPHNDPQIVSVDPLTAKRTSVSSSNNDKYIDIRDYMNNPTPADKELDKLASDFDTIRGDLARELDMLNSFNGIGSDEISFTDLEPESYKTGMGRAA